MTARKLSDWVLFGAGAVVGLGTSGKFRRPRFSLKGKAVLITGGSRGLGLCLAHEFANRGARIAISARDGDALRRATESLRRQGAEVLAIESDVSLREEAEFAVGEVRRRWGHIDVLVNNAGTICVGPMQSMTIDDYRNSINTHFWGPYFTTMAALPDMQRRRQGRVVNISSIGGKISVPHLLPYSVGKFALTGFSEGLRSEMVKDNVLVTAVYPGLMRTGSPRNALFKGNNKAEYAWFSISDSLPVLSMNAQSAARQIVNACVRGDAEIVLTLPAKLAVKAHGIFAEATADVLGAIVRLLPSPGRGNTQKEAKAGRESFSKVSPSWITALNENAAVQNNQIS